MTMTDTAKDMRALARIARAFLAHFNPTLLAEDVSQQWQALEHECEKAERLAARQEASVEEVAKLLCLASSDYWWTPSDHKENQRWFGRARALLAEYSIVKREE